jgi:predicted TIM-barrel fold metal-dependent hydrolase
MIVDSHAYCFPPLEHPAGHPSTEEHIKWVQVSQAGHHQPAFRIRDRAPGDSRVLSPSGRDDVSDLPDLDFGADNEKGRVVWTYKGEKYTKHFYPPNLRNLEYTPHSLIGEMDYAGVDAVLLHTDPMLTRDSAWLAECVRAHPDRIRSMAPVDEWRIIDESDAVIGELTEAIKTHGLHAIKFIPPLAYITGDAEWDDGPYRPFWEAATALGVPVFFTLGTTRKTGPAVTDADHVDGYLEQHDILMRWMERYPNVVCSLTHGFPWRVFLDGDGLTLPEKIWAPFENPKCHLEICFPVRLGDLFDFPYREVWPTLAAMVERIGAARLLWGTDMPFQNRFCTYRQSRDWIEKYCSFLSDDDRDRIMGGTASAILGL